MRPRPNTKLAGWSASSSPSSSYRAAPGDRADLVEAAGIEQGVDALAHGEPARVVLALDLLGAAHFAGERLAAAQLLDVVFPAHDAPGHLDRRNAQL